MNTFCLKESKGEQHVLLSGGARCSSHNDKPAQLISVVIISRDVGEILIHCHCTCRFSLREDLGKMKFNEPGMQKCRELFNSCQHTKSP